MIQMQTLLTVADNSGAKSVVCIKVLKGSKRRYASVGDVVKVAVQDVIPSSKIKSGQVSNALVVRVKKDIRRKDGSVIRFGDNAVVLLNSALVPLATRVFGPVCRELRQGQFMKIVSLAPEVL